MQRHSRLPFIALAFATILLGLGVHLGGTALSAPVRDAVGDGLWAVMIFFWISAIAPALTLSVRAGVSLAVCVAVELSQLWHTPALDAIRATRLGHLVLGSDFDGRDLLSYAGGILVVAAVAALAARGKA